MYQASNYITFCHRPDPRVFEAAGAKLYDYNQMWMDLCDSMLAKHRDFHVGNETIMEKHASVKDGLLCVGDYSYSVAVVPASLTWSPSTSRLLCEFAASGGKVIAVEPLPALLNGVPAEKVLPESTEVVADFDASLERALDNSLPRDIVMPECLSDK